MRTPEPGSCLKLETVPLPCLISRGSDSLFQNVKGKLMTGARSCVRGSGEGGSNGFYVKDHFVSCPQVCWCALPNPDTTPLITTLHLLWWQVTKGCPDTILKLLWDTAHHLLGAGGSRRAVAMEEVMSAGLCCARNLSILRSLPEG